MSEQSAPVNAQGRVPTMVCDIRFRRFLHIATLIVAACATSAACAPFGEAPGDGPPVEISRSADPTDAPGDGGARSGEGAASSDASPDAPKPETGPTGGCNGGAGCARVVFVTSTTFLPYAFGSLAEADTRCNTLASKSPNKRVSGRSYVAWLSDSTASPSTRMVHGTAEYVRPDEVRIAKNFADLTSGAPLDNAIAVDEQDETQAGFVWTGTGPSGASSGSDCGDWSNAYGVGTLGTISASKPRWTNSSPVDDGFCTTDVARLYCFEK